MHEAIEVPKKSTHLITDKTGTLTAGKPEVVSRCYVSKATTNTISCRLRLSLESRSEHPLARAIVEAAKKEKIELTRRNRFSLYEPEEV